MKKLPRRLLNERLKPNARDRSIFEFLFENRVATSHQIGKRLFGSASRPTVQRRVSKLAKAEYLSKSAAQLGSRWNVLYGLSEKGFAEMRKSYRFPITRSLFKSDSIKHDLNLVEIRDRLEKKKMVKEYLPENVLQACGSFLDSGVHRSFVTLNSDAALWLEMNQGQFRVALEYEASAKDQLRCSKKLLEYYLSSGVAAVFYVCETGGIERLIRQIDREVGKNFEPKIYTCSMNILLKEGSSIPFVDRDNARLLIQ